MRQNLDKTDFQLILNQWIKLFQYDKSETRSWCGGMAQVIFLCATAIPSKRSYEHLERGAWCVTLYKFHWSSEQGTYPDNNVKSIV